MQDLLRVQIIALMRGKRSSSNRRGAQILIYFLHNLDQFSLESKTTTTVTVRYD
jgi:hypothetical protein